VSFTRARLRRAGRLLAALFAVQLVLLSLGFIFQSVSAVDDRRRFPPPGTLVDVGDRDQHLHCLGPGRGETPTVILEGGLGAPGLMWARVQPLLAASVRVCSYDRAGYGWSDPGPAPRTARRLVEELHLLLERAGESPPYLLVGHSFGGILARIYAGAYPGEVMGLVLVDARHEDSFSRMPADYLRTDEENLRNARLLRIVTPAGITRLAGMAGRLDGFESYLSPLPDTTEPAAWATMIYNPQHWTTAVFEREAIAESYRQAGETALPPGLPLVVLTAEHGLEAWRGSRGPAGEAAGLAWMGMQEELAGLSSDSQWKVVAGSGHYIHLDRPDSVVEAVLSMTGE
jgi:pimeloyl-ACP methyl ester carboxylesterase